MTRFTYTGLALGAVLTIGAARPIEPLSAGVAATYANVIEPDRVLALTALPGETVTLAVAEHEPASGYVARPTAGRVETLGTKGWAWTAPAAPGLYPIQVVGPDGAASVTLQAFVLVPYDSLEGEVLNGYRIGRYHLQPPRYAAPAGFIEVTPANQDVLVSPHFRLKQFLCKQPGGSTKYVVLNPRLLDALEYSLEKVNAAGYRATSFSVMSGYRTPAYNRSIGNSPYSMHQWGAAADIFIDENGDGVLDDLNGDRRSDNRDGEVLHRLIAGAADQLEGRGLIGGLGKYPTNANHGPFVHVDVRDRRVRWVSDRSGRTSRI